MGVWYTTGRSQTHSVVAIRLPNRHNRIAIIVKRKLHCYGERASLIANSGADSHKLSVKSDMERTCLQGPNLSSYEDSILTYAVVLLQSLMLLCGRAPMKVKS